jgi:signal transduction histidine kinase
MEPVFAFALGALGMAVFAVPVVLWQGRRLADGQRRQALLNGEIEKNHEILAATPDGLYVWDHAGGEQCSRRLAVLLGLAAGTESRFDDVLARFGTREAEVLEAAVAALRGEGRGFDVLLAVAGARRTVHAVGVRAGDADGRALADLLWMRDAGEAEAREPIGIVDREAISEDDRIQALLDELPMPVWLRDAHLDVAFVNRAGSGTGITESTRDLAARAGAGKTALAERHLATLNEGARLLEVTETPVTGWAGTLGFAMDRSAAEEMDGEFARQAGAQAQVLENLSTAIAIFGPDATLNFFNTAYAELWRVDGDWLSTGPTLGEVLERLRELRRLPEHADFRAFKDSQLAQFGRLSEKVEDLVHLPDGATLRSVVSPHPLGGLVFAYEDVTGGLALERSYNTLIAVQRETLDNLYEGIAVFGSDGRLKLSNPIFAGLWNLDEDELAKEPHISEFVERMQPFMVGEDDWPAAKERIAARLIGREPSSGRLIRADGTVIDYANVPLPDGAVLLSYLDVTDSVRVEFALRQRADALHEADRLKSEFIANVSYEVRTPLNTILGFAQILSEEYFGKLNRRQKEYSQGILDASNGMMSVVSDILDLATIEAGMIALELDTVELHSMLAGVFGLIRERARRRTLTLEFDCPPRIGWVVADEKRLKQVVFNLLSNAVAFTPPRGTVRLEVARQDETVSISVSDTGVGIPQADQERVFRTFERGSVPGASQGGAGLGLSLVKRFIELHGGTVELESLPNKGTTVICTLPAGGGGDGS